MTFSACRQAYQKFAPRKSEKLKGVPYIPMVKHAVALKLGMADAESILRRFTRNNIQHPMYKALFELSKVIKTVFLCCYLSSEEVRREVHEGLNVVESWNSTNGFIFYGKADELATNRRENQEAGLLSLHLLQASLVSIYIRS